MLSALNKNNEKINAKNATRNNEYFCPVCGESLILKQGTIYVPHFAHKANSNCYYSINESRNHMVMKEIIREYVLRNNNVVHNEFEYMLKFPNGKYLIADYYAEIKHKGKIFKTAFEIVEAHDNYDDFEAKNVMYFDNDIYVVWIFNHEHVNEYHYRNGENCYGYEQKTKNIHRVAHALGFGKVYSIDINDEKLYCTHFYPVEHVTMSCDDCDYDGTYYCDNKCILSDDYPYGEKVSYPKNLKYPYSKEIINFNINSFQKQYKNKYVHFNVCKANMYIKPWW